MSGNVDKTLLYWLEFLLENKTMMSSGVAMTFLVLIAILMLTAALLIWRAIDRFADAVNRHAKVFDNYIKRIDDWSQEDDAGEEWKHDPDPEEPER